MEKSVGVSKTSTGSFRVTFWNPINGTQKVIKTCKTEVEAQDIYNESQWDFYSENKYLLPKGIRTYVSRSGKKSFVVQGIALTKDKVDKAISIGYYNNLQEAKESVLRLIQSFI